MNYKLVYWISVSLITVLLSFGLASFFVSVDREKIEVCREIGEIDKNEAYFECLEQNSLDTWDMAHEELTLKIVFWVIFLGLIFIFLALLLIPFVVIWDII